MGTLRYAMLNALLTPLDEQAKQRTPENEARNWLQAQLNETGFASDFRILDNEQTGLNAAVTAEVCQAAEWREIRLVLEFAEGHWAVTGFEWVD